MSQSAAADDGRSIRLFISSTFRDMVAERDVLIKHVFPEIRRLCEGRGVAFSEVDLRWGVTDEQVAEGEVLPICLLEIERSRPYFIGLLGERYGWIPDELTEELLARQPWLAKHAGRSVTELEVQHGVLENPEMAAHARFYLRDPAYLQAIEAERRSDFEEVAADPTEEEATKERRAKLAELKRRIRSSRFPVRDYANPEEVGELVLADLTRLIDDLYPPGSEQDSLAAETIQHEAFARSRAAVYVERAAYFDALDRFVDDAGREAIAATGESGTGKSALLASWALRHRESHPDDLTVIHFIGSSRLSADPDEMLRRLSYELAKASGVEVDAEATDAEALRRDFARLLYAAGTRKRVVLVLDALNQLVDRDASHELGWLPPKLPDGVRLVVSALPGPALEAAGRRGWLEEPLEVGGLARDERLQLIERYLTRFTKRLNDGRSRRIASHPRSANPLFLRALLDELRVWGEHETLDTRLDDLLEARSIDDLFEVILSRYEADYEDLHPGLVGESMSLIWASRNGLTDAELLELMGTDGEPLPRAAWAPLQFAAGEMLVDRAGLLSFAHDFFRRAVEDRFVGAERSRRRLHHRLAALMEARGPIPRTLKEAPWQFAEASDWEQLVELLVDPEWLNPLGLADADEVRSLWARIESNSALRAVDAYDPGATTPDAPYWIEVAALLAERGEWDAAETFIARVHALATETGNRTLERVALNDRAGLSHVRGDDERALDLYRRAEQVARTQGDVGAAAASLGRQARIHQTHGRVDRALKLNAQAVELCRARREVIRQDRSLSFELQVAIGRLADIHRARGDVEKATELFREQETVARDGEHSGGLADSLLGQAAMMFLEGDLDGAMDLANSAGRIFRELGNRGGEAGALGLQGRIYGVSGELNRALELLVEAEDLARSANARIEVQRALTSQAAIHEERGEPERAVELYAKAEAILKGLGNLRGVATVIGNQALIEQARGELDRAGDLFAEQEATWMELGDQRERAVAMCRRAIVHIDAGDPDHALELLAKHEVVCRELGDAGQLAISLANQAAALRSLHRVAESRERVKAACDTASEAGFHELADQIASDFELD